VSSDPETTRIVRSWLDGGVTQLPDRVLDAVLDQVPATAQRRVTWWPARRTPFMSKFVTIGLGAAAVVVAVFIGAQLLGSPGGGTGSEATVTPEPIATPEPSVDAGLPVGTPLAWLDSSLGDVPITITIPAKGWRGDLPSFAFAKDDNANPPDGAAMLSYALSGGWLVPADPCQWDSTMADTPSAAVDELVVALSAQALRDASAPIDISVGGHAGQSITLHVPDPMPADCDDGLFCTMAHPALIGADSCERTAQGPGQIDELWIVDVDGTLVVIDAAYYEGTPEEHIAEMRAIIDSVTFEAP
jgi:hypothetical protein